MGKIFLKSPADSDHLKISDYKIALLNNAELYLFKGSISKLSHIKIINEHGNIAYYNAADYLKFLEKSNKQEEEKEFRELIHSLTKNKLDKLKDKTQLLNTLGELEELIDTGFILKNDTYEALIENIEIISAHEDGDKPVFLGEKLFDLLLKTNPKNITDPVDLLSTIYNQKNSYLFNAVFKKINHLPEPELYSLLSSDKFIDDLKKGYIKPVKPFLAAIKKLRPEHASELITRINESGYKEESPSIFLPLANTKKAFEDIESKIEKFKCFLEEEYNCMLNNTLTQETIVDQGLNISTLENVIIPAGYFSKHNQALLNNMQEQYKLCNTFLDKLKLNDTPAPTVLDYQTRLKSLADCILEDENKQKIKSHIRDTRFKKCIAGIIIALTGVLPALIALGIKALISSKRHFTLFTSEGDKLTNEILHHVKKLKP